MSRVLLVGPVLLVPQPEPGRHSVRVDLHHPAGYVLHTQSPLVQQLLHLRLQLGGALAVLTGTRHHQHPRSAAAVRPDALPHRGGGGGKVLGELLLCLGNGEVVEIEPELLDVLRDEWSPVSLAPVAMRVDLVEGSVSAHPGQGVKQSPAKAIGLVVDGTPDLLSELTKPIEVELTNLIIVEVTNLINAEVRNLMAADVTNLIAAEVRNLIAADVTNLIAAEVANLIAAEVTNLIAAEVTNLIAAEVTNLIAADVSNLIAADVSNLITAEVKNLIDAEAIFKLGMA